MVLSLDLDLRYLAFALADLIFAIPELVLLTMAFKTNGNDR